MGKKGWLEFQNNQRTEYWFIYQGDCLLVSDHTFPLKHDNVQAIKSGFLRTFNIAQLEYKDVFCAEINHDFKIPDGFKLISLKKALEIDPELYAMVVKAHGILNWDKTHQYCGKCGHKTIKESDLFERKCKICQHIFYPRISPSIIVLVQKNDEILMARSFHFSKGTYGLIAGFVEVGENIEDAVHRELMEEVGIKVKNLRYFGSQAWPFPDSLMIGFFADYSSGELTIDRNEIECAGWYKIDQLPGLPSTVSIARSMIESYRLSVSEPK